MKKNSRIELAKSLLESNGYRVTRIDEGVGSANAIERIIQIDDELGYTLGLLAQPKNDDVPFAWDAGIFVEGGNVVMEGNVAPGGTLGSVLIKVPVDRFFDFYDLLAMDCTRSEVASLGLSPEDEELVLSTCTF